MAKRTNTEYKNDFAKENYDRIIVTVKKGIKPTWEQYAKSKGQSLNAFIHEAVNEHIEQLSKSTNENCQALNKSYRIMDYRQKLKEYRLKNKYSQREIAKILNISQQHYSLYEQGIRELPITHYIILSRYYNVKIDDLIEIIEEPNEDKPTDK